MNRPTAADLEALFRHRDGPCVSMYLPTHTAGPDIRQDPIRLKNLLRSARERVLETGRTPEATDAFLAGARELLDDRDFWRHQVGGLAVLLAPGLFQTFRIPAELEELVVVGPRFHLLPLVPHVRPDRNFHLLSLSQNRVRLFAGDADRLEEIDADAIPEELRDVVGYDFEQRSLQFHSGTGAPRIGGGRRPAIFHGHGGVRDDDLSELERFVRGVDDAVCELVGSSPPPLVLAAVERVAVAYREVSRHPNLVDEILEGNPEPVALGDLHRRGLALVEPSSAETRARALEAFEAQRASDRTGEGLEEVVRACEAGRVELLLHTEGESRWGTFDHETRQLETHERPRPGDEDLVDRAALECLTRGGRVLALPPGKLPNDAPLAAVYRY